jgi:hypothetical protein
MLTLLLTSVSILYIPTFAVNSLIILKEVTLNQFAWSSGEEYNTDNLDILYWLGVNEDLSWYIA